MVQEIAAQRKRNQRARDSARLGHDEFKELKGIKRELSVQAKDRQNQKEQLL
jgi:hypothetical protein